MAEWTDPQIRTLIDERRTRNDEFHNLGRNQKIFWNSIADKINQENGTSFNGHQCKEKFSNLVWDYNAMCDFMSGRKSSRSRLGVQYFDEFRTHFWERPEDEFDRVRIERELRSSKRRLSRSPSISQSQSPSIGRRSRRQSPPVRRRHSVILPVSSLTTNDEMDISDTKQLVGQRRTSTHEELSLSLHLPPSYDIATAQESSNVRGNIQ
uniref:Myb/SANT-like DNA-binding domain-containing protein n=1 Tax=Rhizophagus irregularis (strain DAOM 181602 / DAOM 197198 / MUCL 43194) TaxID=747089 RepID=U9UB08_RHIID